MKAAVTTSSNPPVIGVVLSPGRTGTSTVAHYLQRSTTKCVVYHERFGVRSVRPSEHFRLFEEHEFAPLLALPWVRAFLDELNSLDMPYVETGWTIYPLLPLLARRFPDRVRVVILTRHPVPTAASLALHGLYELGRESEFQRGSRPFIEPSSARVYDVVPALSWQSMTLYERNLYRVSQLYKFADECQGRLDWIPVLRARTEDLNQCMPQIAQHFGLSVPTAVKVGKTNGTRWLARAARGVNDEWRHTLRWPWAIDAAQLFGYAMDPDALHALGPRMDHFRTRGILQRSVRVAYQVPVLRRAWSRGIWPILSRKHAV